jgi:hypothetical protein
MNRAEVFSGGFRALLSAGNIAHLTNWVKGNSTRTASISINYATGEALWQLTLTDGETRVFYDTASTLETLAALAVVAISRR